MLKTPQSMFPNSHWKVCQNIGKFGGSIFNIERAILLIKNSGRRRHFKTECVIFLDKDGREFFLKKKKIEKNFKSPPPQNRKKTRDKCRKPVTQREFFLQKKKSRKILKAPSTKPKKNPRQMLKTRNAIFPTPLCPLSTSRGRFFFNIERAGFSFGNVNAAHFAALLEKISNVLVPRRAIPS